ncbi:MAG: DUF554 domain-containing protein [Candidatus Acetothermia bacterium]
MKGIGTLINIATVSVGGSLGLLVGRRLSENLKTTVMRGLGLITLVIGFRMAFETLSIFVPMGSVVVGGVVGEMLGIKTHLDSLGAAFKRKFAQYGGGGDQDTFSKGFVTASLVFCVGPMTVIGAVQDGLTGDFTLLAIKAGLDGFAAMAFASTLGLGVLFSIFTLVFYQGGLTLLAALLSSSLAGVNVAETAAVNELSATGGVLIIGIGLMILEIKEVKVSNYLPAIILAPLIVLAISYFGISL